jgi:hypothetical protein
MIQQTQNIRIRDNVLNLVNLPEAAQEELVTFYEFLVYKYQQQNTKNNVKKQQVLSAIFEEANGILPTPYVFDREALHER